MRAKTARLTAGLTTIIAGALSFISAITPDAPWRREMLLSFEPGPAAGFAHLLAATGGVGLVVLGWGIVRGRRRAARTAIVVLVILAALHLVKGLDYEESSVALALAVLLSANRRAFKRGGEPRAGLIAGTVAVGAVAMAYTVDVADLLMTERARGLGSALRMAADAMARGAWWFRSGEPVAIVLDLLLIVCLAAATVWLRALLRPVQARYGHTSEEHWRAADIVARHGADSLDAFALREDKAFHFAHGGFLAYRTLRETAVVAGDPVGPPGSGPAIASDFMEFASSRGWDVVFTGISPAQLPGLRSLGLRAQCIGQEAVVEPDRFSLDGRPMRKVRQSVHRVQRRGWSVEVAEDVVPSGRLADEIHRIEQAWRAERKRVYGFAMCLGRLWGAPEDGRAVYVLGRDPAGDLQAFIRFVRCADGLSLDSMRRSGCEPNGLYEAMISSLLGWAGESRLGLVSLNFAGFAHVMWCDDVSSLTRRERALRAVLTRAHGRFQLERLASFNQKFKPDWRPRYLVYGSRTHLPLAALRVLQAEAYIRPPRGRALERRWEPLPHPVDAALRLPPPQASP